MKKSIIITGIYGLIGSNFAKWVLTHKPKYQIYGIDNRIGGLPENKIEDTRVHYYHLDLSDNPSEIEAVFQEAQPEYVFHFAAYAAEGLSPFIRRFNYINNLVATATVVNCCIKFEVSRLVFTSSMAVYGKGYPPFSENDECIPVDPYGNAKLACERDIRMAWEQFGLKSTILRPHNVYGPGQNIFDPYRNVLGIWMYRILHKQPILVYGDGSQTRSFTYVDDILKPIWNAAEGDWGCRVFNLGETPKISIEEAACVVKTLGRLYGFEPEIEHVEPRHEVKEAFVSGQSSIKHLGFEYKTNLGIGLRQMWEWVNTLDYSRSLDSEPFNLDIEKGMYSYWKK